MKKFVGMVCTFVHHGLTTGFSFTSLRACRSSWGIVDWSVSQFSFSNSHPLKDYCHYTILHLHMCTYAIYCIYMHGNPNHETPAMAQVTFCFLERNLFGAQFGSILSTSGLNDDQISMFELFTIMMFFPVELPT